MSNMSESNPSETILTKSNNSFEEDSKEEREEQSGKIVKEKKRGGSGWRPAAKRNRKRPKSELHALNEDFVYKTNIRPLELYGKPIKSTTVRWLRLVEPYPYTFTTYAKARWEGRTVLDVYCDEFGSYPKSYYESAITQGRILVSDKNVDPSYIIKGGDVLSHTVHRHEPGVGVMLQESPYVTVIEETDKVLVVDKPGTLPVHSCGGYHVQSLVRILGDHYGQKFYNVHRLDRLTSGLVILAKNSSVAQTWGKCIKDRDCQKIYLARVKGKFPLNCPKELSRISNPDLLPDHGVWQDSEIKRRSEESTSGSKQPSWSSSVDVSLLRKQYAHAFWIVDEKGNIITDESRGMEQVFESQHSVDDWLHSIKEESKGGNNHFHAEISGKRRSMLWFHLACPTRISQPKIGICEAGSFDNLEDEVYKKTVKPAESSFGVVSYDAKTDSTVLICRPYTGRTHQLRLHLQHLGHSIGNDPNYGGDMWYGNPEGREACTLAQSRLDVINEVDNTNAETGDTETTVIMASTATDIPATEGEIQMGVSSAVQGDDESIHDFIERTCVWCARCRAVGGSDRAVLEFLIRSSGIWLHALQYSFATNVDNEGRDKTSNDKKIQTFKGPLPPWHEFE